MNIGPWQTPPEGTKLGDLKLLSGTQAHLDTNETILIGDVNELYGVCDDCCIDNRIVLRYRKVDIPLE